MVLLYSGCRAGAAFPVIPFGDFIAALSVLPRRDSAIPLYRYTEPPTPRQSSSRGYSREPFFGKKSRSLLHISEILCTFAPKFYYDHE